MDTTASAIVTWASNQGIGVLMLLFAIYWLNQQNKKAAADVKAALDVTAQERGARLGLMEQSMGSLVVRVNECEKDRQQLWIKVVDLSAKQGHNTEAIATLKQDTKHQS